MTEEQQTNRISSGVIAAVSAAIVGVSGGVALLTRNSSNPPQQNQTQQPTKQQVQSPGKTAQSGVEQQDAQIYLLRDTGKNLELVPQPVKVKAANQTPNEILEQTFNTLLADSKDGNASSTIPQGTKLLGVKVENDGVHVNLSNEFTAGGGVTSMSGRLGQVVYTATTLDPNAQVWIEVDGKKLDVLGGEGLELEQPLTRKKFDEHFPL